MKRISLLLGTLLVSTTVLAQSAAPPAQDAGRQRWHDRSDTRFTEADSNHDGDISQSEWQSARLRDANEWFQRLDSNRDGKLTRTELDQARSERMGKRPGERMQRSERIRALDKDGDQQLSRAEIGNEMPRLSADFGRLDTNGDGKLSREEIRAGREHGQLRDGSDVR
jgi:Ca2+-binding EF-hand superfamily protein